MSFTSVAANAVLRIVGVLTVAAAGLVSVSVSSEPIIRAQSAQRAAPSKVRLPDEAAGIDGAVGALISVYDRFDVVALGEMHERKVDSDLRIALVRHPGFAKTVRTIVVEFATTTEQTTLDRYIRGENVSRAQLERVRQKAILQPGIGRPNLHGLFAAVREVNSRLPADARIRVFGGEDNRNRDTAAVSILKEQVLQKPWSFMAMCTSGEPGYWNREDVGHPLSRSNFRGDPSGRPNPRGQNRLSKVRPRPNLKTQVRPVMVPLQRLPFRDFTAAEFLGGQVVTLRGGSMFTGSTLTLGQMADACVYLGRP